MNQDDSIPLEGEVQCDECYIGGKEYFKHESKKLGRTQGGAKKVPVFGMVEPKGRVVAIALDRVTSDDVIPIIGQFVKEGSTIYTDESFIYRPLDASDSYSHEVVKHSAKEFSRGCVNTNAIEGFWSEMRRGFYGIHHHISREYISLYIDEQAYRYNTRKMTQSDVFADLFLRVIGKVTYKDVRRLKVA